MIKGGVIMKENLIYYVLTVVVIIMTALCFTLFSNDDDYIVDFLGGYGYEVSARPIDVAQITIPVPLNEVYEQYNKIQQKAGFDLRLYEGKKGVRYTYAIKNYPGNEEDVRANVLVIDGEIVGGDICTLKIDGFMHELRAIEASDT